MAFPQDDSDPPYFEARLLLFFLPVNDFHLLQTAIVCSAIFDIIISE